MANNTHNLSIDRHIIVHKENSKDEAVLLAMNIVMHKY